MLPTNPGIYDTALKSITSSTESAQSRMKKSQSDFNMVLDMLDQEEINNALAGTFPTSHTTIATPVGHKNGKKGFKAFVDAIAAKESGGNYGAVNKSSGAAGKYQIMPANIPSWSKEALGHSVSLSKFMARPRLQDKVALPKLEYYYNKYGAAGAAKAWYGGEGSVKKGGSKSQGVYPSINKYSAAIVRGM